MSKKIQYLTGCLSAAQNLFNDAVSGQMRVYDVPNFPTGIIPAGYLSKCSSVVVAVTGVYNMNYMVVIPSRPDNSKNGTEKEIDIDPVAFCFDPDSGYAYPTGVALFHQNFSGRTYPQPGYKSFTLTDTVKDLQSKLQTGIYPASALGPQYSNAIKHAVNKLDRLAGKDIERWKESLSADADSYFVYDPESAAVNKLSGSPQLLPPEICDSKDTPTDKLSDPNVNDSPPVKSSLAASFLSSDKFT